MNPNQLKRLEQLKNLNSDFCRGSLQVTKNFGDRKQSIEELGQIDYNVDRIDRSLWNKNNSYLFIIDIDFHETKSLKEMIKVSHKISKIIDNKFPNFFSTKFSARGFHMIALIKDDDKIVNFLKEKKIEKVYDFARGICYGIFLNIKNEIKQLERELEIKNLQCFDYQRYCKSALIRSFSVNSKAYLNNLPMFSIPVSLKTDSINDIVNKSMLLKDFSTTFNIPTFNDNLYKLYKPVPKEEQESEDRPLRLDLKDADIPFTFNPYILAPCLQELIRKKDLGNRERFILIGTLLSIPWVPVNILQLFRQYLSPTTFQKMRAERQIEAIFNKNQRVKNCHVIKQANLCLGCELTKPFFLREPQMIENGITK